jgi:hypothetical protein
MDRFQLIPQSNAKLAPSRPEAYAAGRNDFASGVVINLSVYSHRASKVQDDEMMIEGVKVGVKWCFALMRNKQG